MAKGGITPQETGCGGGGGAASDGVSGAGFEHRGYSAGGVQQGFGAAAAGGERGVKAEEILAIGDNWNDVSMLEVAGQAVLMGNAPEDLKAVAAERGWVMGRGMMRMGWRQAIEAVLTRSASDTIVGDLSGVDGMAEGGRL